MSEDTGLWVVGIIAFILLGVVAGTLTYFLAQLTPIVAASIAGISVPTITTIVLWALDR